eukprot:SAG11_NODE_10395_length_834_cov_2.151020_1_plen_65_part_01
MITVLSGEHQPGRGSPAGRTPEETVAEVLSRLRAKTDALRQTCLDAEQHQRSRRLKAAPESGGRL